MNNPSPKLGIMLIFPYLSANYTQLSRNNHNPWQAPFRNINTSWQEVFPDEKSGPRLLWLLSNGFLKLGILMIFHYWWNCDQLPNHTQHNWGADFKDLDTSKHDVFCPENPCAYLLWVLRNGVSKFDEIWIFLLRWNFGLSSRKDQDSWEAQFWRITTSSHAASGCKKLSLWLL